MFCMKTRSELVTDWRLRVGLSRAEVARRIGTSRQNINNLETGRVVNAQCLPALAKLMGYSSTDELLQLKDPPNTQPQSVEPGPDIRGRVPLISWVQAGNGNGAYAALHPGEAERWLECPTTHSEHTYALRVRGDSMTAPHGNSRTYPEGCIVFVDSQQRSPFNGQRVIAKLEDTDEVTFKVFKQEDGRIWLQPINPTHDKLTQPFKVLGTVIGKWEDE